MSEVLRAVQKKAFTLNESPVGSGHRIFYDVTGNEDDGAPVLFYLPTFTTFRMRDELDAKAFKQADPILMDPEEEIALITNRIAEARKHKRPCPMGTLNIILAWLEYLKANPPATRARKRVRPTARKRTRPEKV